MKKLICMVLMIVLILTTLSTSMAATQYIVGYDEGDHGILKGDSQETVSSGGNPSNAPTVVPDSGYNFIGWSDGSTISTDLTDFTIKNHTLLTAQYELKVPVNNKYTVTYAAGTHGKLLGDLSEIVNEGESPDNEPIAVPDEGYNFVGWSDGENQYSSASEVVVTGSITLTALYDQKYYFVTLRTDEHCSFEGESQVITETVYHGETLSSIPVVVFDEDYSNAFWFDSSDGSYHFEIDDIIITSARTFTANSRFTGQVPKTKITYYPGEFGAFASGNPNHVEEIDLGASPQDLPEVVPDEGYIFEGWWVNSQSRMYQSFQDGDLDGEVEILTAQYRPEGMPSLLHDVTYQAGEFGIFSSGRAVDTETVLEGETLQRIPEVMANPGYEFAGWYDGIEIHESIVGYIVPGEMTLTAIYIQTGNINNVDNPEESNLSITIQCYENMNADPLHTYTLSYPSSGYAMAPVLLTEGLKLMDFEPSVKLVEPSGTVSFRYSSDNGPYHGRYINGGPDGMVRPDASISRQELAVIFYRMIQGDEKENFVRTGDRFSDITLQGPWGATEIEYMNSIGLITGYPDGSFQPNNEITREEFLTIVIRYANYNPNDVEIEPLGTGSWSEDNLARAVAYGFTAGLEEAPVAPEWTNREYIKGSITRAEVIVVINALLNRYADDNHLEGITNPFSDLSTNHWAYSAILEASVSHGFSRDVNGNERWED